MPAHLPVSQLSHSSLSLLWRCPERWRRRYVLRERESVGGRAVIGKAVGAALTARFAAQIAGHSLSLTDADDLYLAEFDDAAPAAFFKDKEPPAVLRRQGRQVLVAYLSRVAPTLRPALRRAQGRAALRRRAVVVRRLPRCRGCLGRADRPEGQGEAPEPSRGRPLGAGVGLPARPVARGAPGAALCLPLAAPRSEACRHPGRRDRAQSGTARGVRAPARADRARDRALRRDRRLGLCGAGGVVVFGRAERLSALRRLPGRLDQRARRADHRPA